MPPTITVVRHAQGEHNATRNYTLRDPLLTSLGKTQCQQLKSTFPHHSTISIVFASPLRRTIQTAAYSFGPALARSDVPFICLPTLQEVGDIGADIGLDAKDLEKAVEDLFEGQDETLGFDMKKLDISQVTEGWNSKKGYWAYTKEALSTRASDLRNSLYQRPESHIVLVTHGAIAHFITEDWDVDDPMTSTAYRNCEVREFVFEATSTPQDAHLVETDGSKGKRGVDRSETDPHVVDELETVVQGGELSASGK